MASDAEQNALAQLFANATQYREDGIWKQPGLSGLQTLFEQVFQEQVPAETILICLQQCGFSFNHDFTFANILLLLQHLRLRHYAGATLGNSILPIFGANLAESYVRMEGQAVFLCRLIMEHGTPIFQMPFLSPEFRDRRQEGTKWIEMLNLPPGQLCKEAVRFKIVSVPGEADTWRLALLQPHNPSQDQMFVACHGAHCGGLLGSDAYYVHTHFEANKDAQWKLTKTMHQTFPNLDVYQVESTQYPDHVLTVGTCLSSPELRRPSHFKEGCLMLWTKSSVQEQVEVANSQQASQGFQWVLLPTDALAIREGM